MRIEKESTDPKRPFDNLQPIIESLIAGGNVAVDGRWVLDPGGWAYRLARPIDFGRLRSQFEFPSTVSLGERHDSVHDQLSWCVIEGPGARSRMDPSPRDDVH
jgi:hypothetical protein